MLAFFPPPRINKDRCIHANGFLRSSADDNAKFEVFNYGKR